MPFNGSGVYTPPVADFPVVTNTVISSTHFNNTINDIATGISNCIAKDGQSTPTANIKLGGFKLTGVGAPTVTNDALTFGQPGTMTTLTATTSVVTPLVGTATAVNFGVQVNGTTTWSFRQTAENFDLYPVQTDNTQSIGASTARIKQVFTPAIDSGTTGSLSLRTNNGTKVATFNDAASGVNYMFFQPGATGAPVIAVASGTDSNVTLVVGSRGNAPINFATSTDTTFTPQFQVLHTASVNRNITITGSSGGNPTIGTTAGNIAFAPSGTSVVQISAQGIIGINATPASSGNGITFPASQSASTDVNTLDDYEEGTWTPSVGGSATYTIQEGTYTKVGRLVSVKMTLAISTIGTGSTIDITGLPFTQGSANSTPLAAGNLTSSATAVVSYQALIQPSSATIRITSRTAAAASDSTSAIFQNSTAICVAGTYMV